MYVRHAINSGSDRKSCVLSLIRFCCFQPPPSPCALFLFSSVIFHVIQAIKCYPCYGQQNKYYRFGQCHPAYYNTRTTSMSIHQTARTHFGAQSTDIHIMTNRMCTRVQMFKDLPSQEFPAVL